MSGAVRRRGARAREAWAHLLLLVPLLLGVAAMHTLGHPHDSDHAPQGAVAGTQGAAAVDAGPGDSGQAAGTHGAEAQAAAGPMDAGDPDAGHGTAAPAQAAASEGAAAATGTHGGAELPPMDPMTMCLAVLGLAILLMGAVTGVALLPGLRRRPPGADLRTVLRALPPPVPPSLATLQVMRV